MNIGEFTEAEDERSDCAQLVRDFKAMGVRCVAKTYEDPAELKNDIQRLRYLIGNASGKYRWLVVKKKGMMLKLVNTEVEG